MGQAPFLLKANARDTAWRTSNEITRQIRLNRSYPNISGSMFFSAKSLKQNPLGLKENLLQKLFRYPALTPPNPRVIPVKPATPEKADIRKVHRKYELSWEKAENNRMFVVYKCSKKSNLNIENPKNILKVTNETSMMIKKNRKTKKSKYNYAVTAISSSHNESEPVVFGAGKK